MKTKLIITFIIFLIINTTVNAQSCERGSEIGDEILLIYRNRTDQSVMPKFHELIGKLRTVWNEAAGNSSAKIYNRAIYFNTKVKGTVIGSTQRTFVSEDTESNKVKIILEKLKGKAETEVCISVFNKEEGRTEQRKYYTFENGNYTKTKTFILNNVSDSYIIINIKGNSTLNSFKYEIKAENIEENNNGELQIKHLKKKAKSKSKKVKQ